MCKQFIDFLSAFFAFLLHVDSPASNMDYSIVASGFHRRLHRHNPAKVAKEFKIYLILHILFPLFARGARSCA